MKRTDQPTGQYKINPNPKPNTNTKYILIYYIIYKCWSVLFTWPRVCTVSPSESVCANHCNIAEQSGERSLHPIDWEPVILLTALHDPTMAYAGTCMVLCLQTNTDDNEQTVAVGLNWTDTFLSIRVAKTVFSENISSLQHGSHAKYETMQVCVRYDEVSLVLRASPYPPCYGYCAIVIAYYPKRRG